MDNSRYPKKCFLALLDSSDSSNVKYNWVSQMKLIYNNYGLSFLAKADVTSFCSHVGSLLISVIDNVRQNDIMQTKESTRYSYYSEILNEIPLPAKYINLRLPCKMVSLIAQLRLNVNSIYFDKSTFEFNKNDLCPLCNKENSLNHFIMECVPINTMNSLRRTFSENMNWLKHLNSENKNDVSKFYYIISASLRLLKFILDVQY